MKAELISVGTELLLGDILNTNAQYLSKELAALGITVHRQSVIGDNPDRLAQLVEDVGERVYPVGRLDKYCEGLLLLTNDGEFANRVAHPTRHVAKTYRVTVRPSVTEDQLNQMSTGIVIEGRRTAPAKVRVLQQELGRVVLEIVLYEGRNREIRKMCEALGLEVARLKRIAVGPVRMGMLPQ